MNLFSLIDIILVAPSHPGNIGATARAIKTMGLENLVLINPKTFPDPIANQRAAGAEDVLMRARIFRDLPSALVNHTLVLGTSVRDREVSWPILSPRDTAAKITQHLLVHQTGRVAVIFGREDRGLTNQELDHCGTQIRIDANSDYSSLNLASSVQIIAHEIRSAIMGVEVDNQTVDNSRNVINDTSVIQRQRAATQIEKDRHLQHLADVLNQLEFARNENSPLLMRKLTRLYNKAELSLEEIHILRGILTAIQNSVSRS